METSSSPESEAPKPDSTSELAHQNSSTSSASDLENAEHSLSTADSSVASFPHSQPPLAPSPMVAETPLEEHQREPNDAEDSAISETEATPPETGSIEDYALRSKKARLPLDEESHASNLLKEILLGGRADVARAVAVIPNLPWTIAVQATAAAWPDMKPSFRSQLLAGLARAQSESAPRTRLSLARGLFKIDQTASTKLILLTLKVLRDKETGLLTGKGAPLFANVLIGRGKAWVLQLPLADLKPSEVDLLVNAALHGAFHAPQAPITQISVLKWAHSLGKISNLPPAIEHLIAKALAKWSSKWQSALRREIGDLPQSWIDVLKPVGTSQSRRHEPREEAESGTVDDSSASDETAEALAESASEDDSSDKEASEGEAEDEEEGEDTDTDTSARDSRQRRGDRGSRPPYVSKTIPPAEGSQPGRRGGLSQNFNLQDVLRQIDQYAGHLRSELHAAQKQLRSRDDDRRNRCFERNSAPVIPGEPTNEELARLNIQLEARNAELTERIRELTSDSEDRAASQGLSSDAPAPDQDTQLKQLLGLKLRDDFEDFQALEEASKDLVVQQHYRSVLQNVFQVLQSEGVLFPPTEASNP